MEPAFCGGLGVIISLAKNLKIFSKTYDFLNTGVVVKCVTFSYQSHSNQLIGWDSFRPENTLPQVKKLICF